MKEVRFTVYGDPVPKARPRVYGNRGVTPQKTKIQEQKIALVYKSQYHDAKFEKDVPLRMVVNFYIGVSKSETKLRQEKMIAGEILPTKRTGDVENLAKLVMDALNGVGYYDDAQIVELVAKRRYSRTPRTECFISSI